MSYLIISMYTVNTPYEEEIKDLEESCLKFNLPYKFYPIQNTGDWTKNTQQKADVCLKALEENDCDVVWIDADAIIFKKPELFDKLQNTDNFNICVRRWFPKNKRKPSGNILSGTIYFKNNEKTKNLVKEWIEKNSKIVDMDQNTLQDVLDENKSFVEVQLPGVYVKINPKENDINNLNAVVGHKQASRKYKSNIKEYLK